MRHWCFTSYMEVMPFVYDAAVVRYCCFQREICAESKRPHWQGYVELYDCHRVGGLLKMFGNAHFEPRKGTRCDARAYCCKKETSVKDTFVEFGIWRSNPCSKLKLVDLLKSKISLPALIELAPDVFVRYHRGLEKLFSLRVEEKAKAFRKMEVLCFIGPTGSGKTKRACEERSHFIMPLSDKLWFDGYKDEECLIIDDFYGCIGHSQLLRILDGHELQLPVKGGFIWAMWTKVIITSNSEPASWYGNCLSSALARRITQIIHMDHQMDVDTEADTDVDE